MNHKKHRLPKSAVIPLIAIISLLGIALIANLTIITATQARISRLSTQIHAMESELSYINTILDSIPCPIYIEDYARQNLDMHNPGDKAFVAGE